MPAISSSPPPPERDGGVALNSYYYVRCESSYWEMACKGRDLRDLICEEVAREEEHIRQLSLILLRSAVS
jgi:hypothetical protein